MGMAEPTEGVLGEGAPVVSRARQLAIFLFQWVKNLDVKGLFKNSQEKLRTKDAKKFSARKHKSEKLK